MQDQDKLLAGEWQHVHARLAESGRNVREIAALRLMFFYGARTVMDLIGSKPGEAFTPIATFRAIHTELRAFDKEKTHNADVPAAQGAGEPDGQAEAPAA